MHHQDFTLNLSRCIEPRSIAVVGASARPGSFGRRTLDNLAHYRGRLYLVNASTQQIEGRRCYASVGQLPQPPDCAIVAVPRDACEAVVRECADAGVGGVVLYASGFSETGDPAHAGLQSRIAALAREAGMALFGPNCLGIVNYANAAVMSFIGWPQPRPLVPHSIGLVSQSGSLGLALAQAAQRGVSFSHVLTYGNAAGVDAADLIAHLAGSPHCRAICCVVESSRSPRALAAAVRRATQAGKPVVFQKIASTEEGVRAALSHTGSLAGGHASYRALMQAAGAVWIEDFEALVETAAFLAKAPEPGARGVAVIGGSGGGGIMAADKAALHGVSLPQPGEPTRRELERHIPEFGAARNPCDVTAQVVSHPQSLAACCDALAADPAFGAIVSTQTVAADEFVQRLPIYEASARNSGKPVCTAWMSEWHEGPGALEFERSAQVAVFHSVDRCFAALRAWHDRADQLAEAARPAASAPAERRAARGVLASCEAGSLSERGSKELLAAYGVPVTHDRFVASLEAARQAAEAAGYPVVLKVEADGLAHKSDCGGVRLNLKDARELDAAWHAMTRELAVRAPQAAVRGFVVAPMVRGDLEIFIGGTCDPAFGPLVAVGLGGVFVEALQDVASAVAPVNADQALRLLRSLRGRRLFEGFRGVSAVDLPRLAEIVSRVSLLLADAEDLIAELDVNPVICGAHGIVAVDALVVRRGDASTPGQQGESHDEQVAHAH